MKNFAAEITKRNAKQLAGVAFENRILRKLVEVEKEKARQRDLLALQAEQI
jgi:hypothetical protein